MREHRGVQIVKVILIVFGVLVVLAVGAGLFLPAVGARQYYTLEEALRSPTSTRKLVMIGRGIQTTGVSLTEVSPEVKQLTNLTHLELGCNNIRHLPEWLTENPKIIHISLAGNQLSVFPPELAKMTNLRELNLNWNSIAELPPNIGNLVLLEWLELDGNRLELLPPEIGKLGALVFLNLRDNRLQNLPPHIGNLHHLERLILSSNHLTDVPDELSRLVSLKELRIDGNRLSLKAQGRLRKLLPHMKIDFGHQVGEGETGHMSSPISSTLSPDVNPVGGVVQSANLSRSRWPQ
jgi:hypothetical protein